MEKENDLEFVLRVLDSNKGKHKTIAAEAGIEYSTLAKISQRVTKNPGVLTVLTLAKYFRENKLNNKVKLT